MKKSACEQPLRIATRRVTQDEIINSKLVMSPQRKQC